MYQSVLGILTLKTGSEYMERKPTFLRIAWLQANGVSVPEMRTERSQIRFGSHALSADYVNGFLRDGFTCTGYRY